MSSTSSNADILKVCGVTLRGLCAEQAMLHHFIPFFCQTLLSKNNVNLHWLKFKLEAWDQIKSALLGGMNVFQLFNLTECVSLKSKLVLSIFTINTVFLKQFQSSHLVEAVLSWGVSIIDVLLATKSSCSNFISLLRNKKGTWPRYKTSKLKGIYMLNTAFHCDWMAIQNSFSFGQSQRTW